MFTPTAHQSAPGASITTTFTIMVADAQGVSSTDSTTTVATTAVSDPPVITGAKGGLAVSDRGTLSPVTGVSIRDVDFGQTEAVTITLSNRTNGTLSNLNGGSYDGKAGVFSITGSDATVTAAVDALVFTPRAHQGAPGATVTTAFTIKATDTAGATSSDTTTTVAATAMNSPPEIVGAVSGQRLNDDTTGVPFSSVGINDPDQDAAETVTITLTMNGAASDANGTLSGAGLTETGIGTYALAVGTPAAVMAALEALVFTPTIRQVSVGDTVTTGMTLTVTDGLVGSPVTDTTTLPG